MKIISRILTCITAILFCFTLNFAQSLRMAEVISERANLRETPSSAGEVGQEVAEGTIVKVLDEQAPWYVVRVGERVGWMHGNTLKFLNKGNAPFSTQRRRTTPPVQSASRPIERSSAGISPINKMPSRTRIQSTDRGYIRGPRGGCYYISGSGRKVYVDRSLCN